MNRFRGVDLISYDPLRSFAILLEGELSRIIMITLIMDFCDNVVYAFLILEFN